MYIILIPTFSCNQLNELLHGLKKYFGTNKFLRQGRSEVFYFYFILQGEVHLHTFSCI